MEVTNTVICTNGGDGKKSYANNSLLQKNVLLKTRSILQDTIKGMFYKVRPTCIKMADLGCASGPNTFLMISQVIDAIQSLCCQQGNHTCPEFEVFLNDLPENDFNTVFKSVPAFYTRLNIEKGDMFGPNCFVSGVPGSFYGRLFPQKSMHFIHSSYAVHWLSKIPQGLENNKGNIYIAKSSPPDVVKVYSDQFRKDFSNFVRCRSEEMMAGGRMLLTILGRSLVDPASKDCCLLYELFAKSLLELVAKGLIKDSDVDSFNLPFYHPCKEEVCEIIEEEGSFEFNKFEIFEINWDPEDDVSNTNFVFNKYRSGQNASNKMRAVTEPMFASHFGEAIIDSLFAKYSELVIDTLVEEKIKHVNIVISMTRK